MELAIRAVEPKDAAEWVRLRHSLWPAEDEAELAAEVNAFFSGHPRLQTFVLVRDNGLLGGLVEVSLRDVGEGCVTSPVGYVEGWYIDEDLRRLGHGRRLIAAAEAWAVKQGCHEMASDCGIDNEVSLRAHLALGYREFERLIHFCKQLGSPPV